MVSRKLLGVWVALDILLLAAGVVALVLSIVWRAPNTLMNMVLSPEDLTAGMVLGVALLVTFAISIAAIVQSNHITIGLVIMNYALLVDVFGVGFIGSFVWFFTLQERNNFHKLWLEASDEARVVLQDQLKCCGYFNNTEAIVGGTFCANPDFVNSLNNSVEANFCVGPITQFADTTLNNVFTTVYGYMAIIICLLLATLCVIKRRQEAERFKKIDEKRGGKGFV
ncbi:hypothetical protein AMATHDRAFT_48971 [Amanita thiersii Skay4041]|uniref:Tetraspanin n=1 Tax=Amanita thiersii Skay4041 TaxID=703135 RepID=A0A2A9NMX1_9AGAR|nr:hypothetical protein AMATHDRAFT_48971 [Amanita thiersii Skay4041]